jgi:hypothetical protein
MNIFLRPDSPDGAERFYRIKKPQRTTIRAILYSICCNFMRNWSKFEENLMILRFLSKKAILRYYYIQRFFVIFRRFFDDFSCQERPISNI